MPFTTIRRLALALIFALPSTTVQAQCPTDDDPGDNDTCATAAGLPIGSNIYAGVTTDAAGNGAAPGAGDDWFFANVPAGGEVVMILNFDHTLGDLDIDLNFGTCGNFGGTANVSSATLPGEILSVTNNTGAAATAWFRVYMVTPGGCNDWTMSVLSSQCAVSSVLENNDSCSGAVIVSDNGGVNNLSGMTVEYNDEDWYRIELPPFTALNTTMTSVPQYGNANIEIRSGCSTVGAQSLAYLGSESVQFINDSDASLSVWMRVFLSTGSCVPYDLDYEVIPCDFLNDGFEPNQSCSSPYVLPAGSNLVVNDLIIGGTGGDDWWEYVLAAGSDLTVTASFLQANADVDLQLETACGSVVATANSATDNEQLLYSNATASAQTVRLRAFIAPGSAGTCTGYSLQWAATANPCTALGTDIYEPNDSCSNAAAVPAGSNVQINGLVVGGVGGEDWYEVNIPPGEFLIVDASFAPASADIDLSLLTFCSTLVDSSDGTTGTESVSYQNSTIANITAQVRVYVSPTSVGDCGTYDLQLTLGPNPCLSVDDPFQGNNTCANAVSVAPNSQSGGLIALTTHPDWWSVDVPAGSTQDVVVQFSGADVTLAVRSSCGGGLGGFLGLGSLVGGDRVFTFTNSSPTTETYYLNVFPTSIVTGECAGYELLLNGSGPPSSITPYCFGDGSQVNCPCNNNSTAGHPGGCAHQNGDGAILAGSGVPSLAADSLHFDLTSAVSNSFALLVSGVNQLPQMGCIGCGIPAFDGLRCAGGDFRRHGSRALDALGTANNGWGPPAGPAGGLGTASGAVAGQSRHYFAFFRTDLGSTCFTGQSSSNGVSVVWAP